METIDVQVAQTQLSRLIDAAAAGEEVVIARAGNPVVRLVPSTPVGAKVRRVLGGMAGRLNVSGDFDAPLPPDILDSFEGR